MLVSVRSGAAASMPGMMDTVLNLGLNDEVIAGIIEKTGNARFAYDIYRRFIDMFGDVVMGCSHEYFEHVIDAAKKKAGVAVDNELSADQLKEVVDQYKEVYKKQCRPDVPTGRQETINTCNQRGFRFMEFRKSNQVSSAQ